MLVRKQDKSFGPQFLRSPGLFLECALVPLPSIVDRGELTSVFSSLQLAIVMCLYVVMEKHVFVLRGLPL